MDRARLDRAIVCVERYARHHDDMYSKTADDFRIVAAAARNWQRVVELLPAISEGIKIAETLSCDVPLALHASQQLRDARAALAAITESDGQHMISVEGG